MVGDAVGDDAPVRARDRVVGDAVRTTPVEHGGVVVPDRPQEHAGSAPPEPLGQDSGILPRLPAQFQGEALPGVHLGRFPWRDAEEIRVELVHPRQETPAPQAFPPRCGLVESEELIAVPAVPRCLRDRVRAVTQQLPEVVGARSMGESAGNSDNRDRAIVCRLELLLLGVAPRHAALAPVWFDLGTGYGTSKRRTHG